MNKIFALILVLILCFTLVSCQQKEIEQNNSTIIYNVSYTQVIGNQYFGGYYGTESFIFYENGIGHLYSNKSYGTNGMNIDMDFKYDIIGNNQIRIFLPLDRGYNKIWFDGKFNENMFTYFINNNYYECAITQTN